ncbi:MAG: TolC family protein [Chryseolinea sp.]
MKRLYQTLLVSLLVPLWVNAQTTDVPSGSFTLEQSITYALENAINIQNSLIDERISDAKVKETRGIGLPQINGTVSLMHNSKLQRFYSMYDSSATSFGGDLGQVPGIKQGDVVAINNFFQLPSNGSAALSFNQILYNNSYLVGLKAASAYRELASKTTQQTKEQIIENVTKAYFAAIINNERIKLFESNIARVDSLFKSTKALNENGFAEAIDVDRIEVTLNNLIIERDKFIGVQELALEILKFQMNYPMASPISVAGDLNSMKIDRDLNYLTEDWNYTTRIDYSILESNRDLQQLDVKNKFSASMPSLSAFANLGMGTQSNNIAGLFKTNSSGINDANGVGPDKWYPASSFGVTLNVPIFSGLQRNYQLQQSKLSLLKIENGFKSLKNGIDLEIKRGTITYENALKSLDAQKRNTTLAENVARVTKIKYQQGVGTNLEVVDAESALREAQINYYSAMYDAIVSRVDLIRAYGKINTLTQPQN